MASPRPIAKLRIVLMADDTVVADLEDPHLWRQLLAKHNGLIAPVPRKPGVRRLAKEIRALVIADEDAERATHIMSLVSEAFSLSEQDIRSMSRALPVALARQVAMYMIRVYTGMSLEAIGAFFGRHHTTVINARSAIKRRLTRAATRDDRRAARVVSHVTQKLQLQSEHEQ